MEQWMALKVKSFQSWSSIFIYWQIHVTILLTEYTILMFGWLIRLGCLNWTSFTMNPDFSRSWDSTFCSVRVYRDLQMGKLEDSGKDLSGKEQLICKLKNQRPGKIVRFVNKPDLRARWKFSPDTILLTFAFRQHLLRADFVHHLKRVSLPQSWQSVL